MSISRIAFLDDITAEQLELLESELESTDCEVFQQGKHGWTESAYIPLGEYSVDFTQDEIDEELSDEETVDYNEKIVSEILEKYNISFEIGQC